MTLDIEGVLAAHGRSGNHCRCGAFVAGGARLDGHFDDDVAAHHRAHVAAVLREQIAAWLTAEGKREMHERGGHWHTVTASDVHVARKLDALAAQVAPSRDGLSAGEGDGS